MVTVAKRKYKEVILICLKETDGKRLSYHGWNYTKGKEYSGKLYKNKNIHVKGDNNNTEIICPHEMTSGYYHHKRFKIIEIGQYKELLEKAKEIRKLGDKLLL